MALVSSGFFVTITVVDASGVNRSTVQYDVVGSDISTAKTNAQSVVAAVDNVTEGLILSYRVGESFEEDTSQFAPAGVQVENQALISVVLEDSDKYALRIPAPKPGIFVDTTGENANTVDVANADLKAFVELFTDKTGYTAPGSDAIALISDGEKVMPDNVNDKPVIRYGKRVHRASRAG